MYNTVVKKNHLNWIWKLYLSPTLILLTNIYYKNNHNNNKNQFNVISLYGLINFLKNS